MDKLSLFYTQFTQPLPANLWDEYIHFLPAKLKDKNSRFVRWQDRHSHLFGKLLLCNALESHGYGKDDLKLLRYNKYDRPYLAPDIDFNISHSGDFVMCAIGENIKLGVDIEQAKKFDFAALKNVMTDEQWEDIHQSPSPMKAFYDYWTIKESVIKAEGEGLSIPLLDIHVKNGQVNINNNTWYLHELPIDNDNYSACLSVNKPNVEIEFKYVDFYKKTVPIY